MSEQQKLYQILQPDKGKTKKLGIHIKWHLQPKVWTEVKALLRYVM